MWSINPLKGMEAEFLDFIVKQDHDVFKRKATERTNEAKKKLREAGEGLAKKAKKGLAEKAEKAAAEEEVRLIEKAYLAEQALRQMGKREAERNSDLHCDPPKTLKKADNEVIDLCSSSDSDSEQNCEP